MHIIELDEKAGEAATLLAAMANEKRLQILCHLFDAEMPVTALAEQLGIAQPTLSQHLAKLRDLKLVATRREGTTVYYKVASDKVEAILKTLYSIYCA